MFRFLSLLLLLPVLLLSKHSNASHAAGAELTYTYVGNNVYQFTYKLFRDCSGISAPQLALIRYSSSCFPTLDSIFLSPIPNTPTIIVPVCSTQTTFCNGGTNIGIEEWVYQGNITLPDTCHDWSFAHSESARNPAITTLFAAGGDSLYVYATLNNTNGIVNNSPVYNNPPVPFACMNQLFTYDHGVYDAEGDSLVYQIIPPRNGPAVSDTVQYVSGLSSSQPVHSSTPMTFDSITGSFSFTSIQTDVTVIAILVSEFRNGILIGQTERDIQLNILACANSLPVLSGMDGTSGFDTTVCVNDTLCFFIASSDSDATQNTMVTINQSFPGATIINSGGNRDSVFFCWTPSLADTNQNQRCFTALVNDDNCPYLGLQSYAYCITVLADSTCFSTTGITDVKSEKDLLKIYPQPAKDYLVVEFAEENLINGELFIMNAMGELISKHVINSKSTKVNLPMIPNGYYIVSFTDDSKNIVSRKPLMVIH